MATQILGGSGYTEGMKGTEAFGNVRGFTERVYRHINKQVDGPGGEPLLEVQSTALRCDFTTEGEINAAVTQFSLSTVSTLGSKSSVFTLTGSIFFDEATVNQERTTEMSLDAKLHSTPTITAT